MEQVFITCKEIHFYIHSIADSSPLQLLQLILIPALIIQWVEYTDAYSRNSHQGDINVTVAEMLAFLALHIYMGIYRLPRMRDYWADEFGDTFARSLMPRNRFAAILSCFCVTEPIDDDTINDLHCTQQP